MNFPKLVRNALVLFCSVTGLATADYPTQEIEEMAGNDAAIRMLWIRAENTEEKQAISHELRQQEKAHTARLKEILDTYGFPDSDDECSDEIGQLVFHSSDIDFQEACLAQFTKLGEDWESFIPQLTDRVLLRRGHAQRYATHFYIENGEAAAYPIENEPLVNSLRKSLGEGPFEDDLEAFSYLSQFFSNPLNSELSKFLFNKMNQLEVDGKNVLYYATLSPSGACPQFQGQFVAFELPSQAAFYALVKAGFSDENDLYFKRKNQPVYSIFDPNNALILNQRSMHVFAVSKEGFQILEDSLQDVSGPKFLSQNAPNAIAGVQCENALEALFSAGGEIRLVSKNKEPIFETNVNFNERIVSIMAFDYTLENESFEDEPNKRD